VVANATFRKSSTDVAMEARSPGPALGLPDGGHPPLVAVARVPRERVANEELGGEDG
jgi:hypothetical protein